MEDNRWGGSFHFPYASRRIYCQHNVGKCFRIVLKTAFVQKEQWEKMVSLKDTNGTNERNLVIKKRCELQGYKL
jgi:hypothetical protein